MAYPRTFVRAACFAFRTRNQWPNREVVPGALGPRGDRAPSPGPFIPDDRVRFRAFPSERGNQKTRRGCNSLGSPRFATICFLAFLLASPRPTAFEFPRIFTFPFAIRSSGAIELMVSFGGHYGGSSRFWWLEVFNEIEFFRR